MATNYPTSLDTLTNPTPNDQLETVSHSEQHANANDAIEALEAKVGADASAVTTSHDFKLDGVADGDKAASVNGTETHTNKTLTSPVINTPDINGGTIDDADITNPTLNGDVQIDLGSDAEGDIYYRDSAGELTRLAPGTDGQIATMASGLPSWATITPGSVSIESTSGTTHSLTTTGAETVFVIASGYQATSSSVNITLQYDGVTKDTVTISDGGGSFSVTAPFTLMYSETPTAGTRDITVSTGTDVSIYVFKLT